MSATEADVIFVLNDETDEPHALECGDTLPPLIEMVETLDTDNPIQYTREQLLFHVLNTITYNVKVVDRSQWIRIANEFVDVMRRAPKLFPKSVVPIVKARRVVVVDAGDSLDAEDDSYAQDRLVPATMSLLLQQRVSHDTTPFKEGLKRLYRVERIFVDGIPDLEVPSVQFKVPHKMRAHLYSSDRKVTLFPETNIYEGDTVEICGFVSQTSHPEPVEFDAEAYRTSLEALADGESVVVWPHDHRKPVAGAVVERKGDMLRVRAGHQELDIHVRDVWKNTAFVHHPNHHPDRMMSRFNALSRGVVTTLLRDDSDGLLTIQTIMPTLEDVFRFTTANMLSLDDAKRVGLEAEIGARFEEMEDAALRALTARIALNITKEQLADFKISTVSARSGREAINILMPDLSGYNYAAYASEGTYADSDVNRLKHLFGQGDDGVVYMLHSLAQSMERVLHTVRKHKVFSSGGAGCPDLMEYRVFKSWESMEAYDDAPVGEVVELRRDGASTLYIRFRAESGKHAWVRHLSQPKQAACSGLVEFKSLAQMARMPCVYDNYEQACASSDALRQQNDIRNADLRAKMLARARAVYDNREDNKAALQKLMAFVAPKSYDAQLRFTPLVHTPEQDYSGFTGDPDSIDFEDLYGKPEDTLYAPIPQPINEIDGDPYVTNLARSLGLRLPPESVTLIANNIESRFGGDEALPSKLEALRQAVHRKAAAELSRQLRAQPNKATRDALIAKAKVWEEQTFAKKKKELEEKAAGSGHKLLYTCALIAIMAQIAGKDLGLEFVQPSCTKSFAEGMVSYVACAARSLGEGEIDKKELEAEVERVLGANAQMKGAYLAALESRAEGAQQNTIALTEWPQFRPLLGKAEEHLRSVRNKKATGVKKCKNAVVLHLAKKDVVRDAPAFTTKPIVFDDVVTPLNFGKRLGRAPTNLPADLAEAMTNRSDAFWDRFTDRTYNLFDILSDKLPLDARAVSDVAELLFRPSQEGALHARNLLRAFLDNELKTVVGKVANRWKAGKKEDDVAQDDVVGVILQVEAIPELSEELTEALKRLTADVLGHISALDVGETLLHSLYILNYVLVYALYAIAALVNKNKVDPLTLDAVRIPKPRFDAVVSMCNLVLRRCAESLKRNTFVTEAIAHTQEVLREERKEKIIQGAERLHGEDKKTFLEATKLGLFTWADLPQEDAAPQEPDAIDRNEYWVMDEDDDEDYMDGGNGEFDD